MNDLDLFSDISRDVAMATNFVEKWQTSIQFKIQHFSVHRPSQGPNMRRLLPDGSYLRKLVRDVHR